MRSVRRYVQGEDAVWTLGLATAHNFVLHWDWSADTILQRVTCAEKCIMYLLLRQRLHSEVLSLSLLFFMLLFSPYLEGVRRQIALGYFREQFRVMASIDLYPLWKSCGQIPTECFIVTVLFGGFRR